mmetsp:Transcript_12089/g.23115  ORF Transcript_12089/g.23115 Transcript_12089/m.23115 type:complete len:136 (+) Transcript_12089:119-526(+)|eukprot:scaffold223_cov145-Amphora_coffeaeformis.AAC.6
MTHFRAVQHPVRLGFRHFARAMASAKPVVCVRCFSSPPAGSPVMVGSPDEFNRSPEEKKLENHTGEESKYKRGKHRSNAIELVHKIPPIEVDGEMAVCDGGGGALGHPLEYISLARPGAVEYCKYCALRYTKKMK